MMGSVYDGIGDFGKAGGCEVLFDAIVDIFWVCLLCWLRVKLIIVLDSMWYRLWPREKEAI